MIMRRRRECATTVLLPVALVLLVGSGCQTPQRRISQEELLHRQDAYLRSYQSDLEAMSVRTDERIEAEYRNALQSTGNPPQCYDVLLLSGGGAFGAFGAGFLEGWGRVTTAEFARPQFDSVSGISTGALIAPFAFVGTPDAYSRIIELYENPGRDWVRKRGIIPYLPGNVSLFDVAKLHDKIRSIVTPDMIQNLAEGAAEGRQLLVGAVNVDYGFMRVWDLARIAKESPMANAIERTASTLLASAAIPGAFPPVLIDDFLYVDGGASMQVVGGTEERDWAYLPNQNPTHYADDGPPIRIRVWIIVNQKLLAGPRVVRPRWTSISARSLTTLLQTSTLQSIQNAETFVRLIDKRPDFDAELRYVAIPQDYPIPDKGGMFNADTMRELVKLGRSMGAEPTSWRTKALRPGAPFDSK